MPPLLQADKKTSCQSLCVFPETLCLSPAASSEQHSSSCRNVEGSFCGYGWKTAHVVHISLLGLFIFLVCWASLPPPTSLLPSPTLLLTFLNPLLSPFPYAELLFSLFKKSLFWYLPYGIVNISLLISLLHWSSLRPSTFMSSPRAFLSSS